LEAADILKEEENEQNSSLKNVTLKLMTSSTSNVPDEDDPLHWCRFSEEDFSKYLYFFQNNI